MRRKYYPSYLAQQRLLTSTADVIAPTALDNAITPLIEQHLATIVGTDTPDAEGLPTDLAGLRSLLRTMLGQQQVPNGPWGMSMNRSATRLNILEPLVAAQQAVLEAQRAGLDQQSTQMQALTANLQLAQQRGQALEAKQLLIASATEANRLDIVALKAADVLLQAQDAKDAPAIAAAQATANQAKVDAAAAQKKADEDAAAVLVAQAAAAQTTATNAQAAVTALAAKFRSATVAVPQMAATLLYIDVVVPWAQSFPDASYVAIAEPAGLVLLGLDATEVTTARTAISTTFRIKNVPGLVIASGGTLSVFAYRP